MSRSHGRTKTCALTEFGIHGLESCEEDMKKGLKKDKRYILGFQRGNTMRVASESYSYHHIFYLLLQFLSSSCEFPLSGKV